MNKYRTWLAKDADTEEIAGVHVGNRDREGAPGLRRSMPAVNRQCAVIFTDVWKSYDGVPPRNRHRPAGEETGKTDNIGSFNCEMRQRISRPVRETLSFSGKKLIMSERYGFLLIIMMPRRPE